MPALTHGRVKNGHNGHSSKCNDGKSCGGQGFNPVKNSKIYKKPVNGNVVRKKELPGSVGISKSVKLAWKRRVETKCCK